MLEIRSGLYGDYLYRDNEYFDDIIFIDYYRRELLGSSGVVYDMEEISNKRFNK